MRSNTTDNPSMGRGLNFHKYGDLKAVQAVVLAAGSGSRMTTLVSSTPKCMLPIASIPMLYYPLYMLQSSGFKECIVVVSCGQEAAVTEMAESHGLTIKLRLYSDSEEDRGTLDSLRHIAKAFTDDVDDVIIVSSDLVSDVRVEDLLTHHRCSKSALTMLTTRLNTQAYVDTPGQKVKSEIDADILMESVAERRLCGSYSGGDYGEHISIPYSILRHGQIIFSKGIVDAHAYVIGAKLFREYVLSDSSPCARMASLKAEAVPHLIAMQFKTNRPPEYDNAIARIPEPFSTLQLGDSVGCCGRESEHWAASACRAYHYAEGLCVRANTIPAYWYLNSKIPAILSTLCPECPLKVGEYSRSEVQPKAVVKGNTLLGAGCLLSDRTTVADSSLGRNCVVKPGCRVTNCVLLDGVSLEPGTVLEGSIVCCTIDQERCTVKKSIIASARTLHPESVVTGNTLEATQFFSA